MWLLSLALAHALIGSNPSGAKPILSSAPLALSAFPLPVSKIAGPAADRLPDIPAAAVLMRRAGLTPENMAAAGLSPEQADQVILVMLLYTEDTAVMPDLENATRALNEGREAATRPPVDTENPGPTVAALEETLHAHLDAAFEFATTSLQNTPQLSLLQTIRRNSTWDGLPPYYLTVEREPLDWRRLRGALTAQRFTNARGRELPPEPAALIADAADDSLVATSREAFDLNCGHIATAFRQRLGE